MRRRKEQCLHKVLLARCQAGYAPAAAVLGPIGIRRQTLDIAKMRQRQTHILLCNQVLHIHFALNGQNLGAPPVAIFIAHRNQLFPDHAQNLFLVSQKIQIIGNALG